MNEKKLSVEARLRSSYLGKLNSARLRKENPLLSPEYDSSVCFSASEFAILLTAKSDEDAKSKVLYLNSYRNTRIREGDKDPNFEAMPTSKTNIIKLTGDIGGASDALYVENYISSAKRNALIQEARAEHRRQKAAAAPKQNGSTNGHDPKLFKATKQPVHVAEKTNNVVSPSAPKAEEVVSEVTPTVDRPSSP